MEQSARSIRRLLSQRKAVRLLSGFATLLPDVAIALVEADGEILARAGADLPADAPADSFPLRAGGERVGTLRVQGPGLQSPQAQPALHFLQQTLDELLDRALESRTLAQETLERYREINLLYKIGETISASLDPDEIPRLVLAEAARVIHSDGGVVLLLDEKGFIVRSGFGPAEVVSELEQFGRRSLGRYQGEDQFRIFTVDRNSSPEARIGTFLCSPLQARERVLGFVSLGRLVGQPIFTAGEEKLMTALTQQAAVAVENARLFVDVRRQRDAIAEIKNYMDNIFASIASGVITTDVQNLVTILNRAAERILGVNAAEMMGRPYLEVLPEIGPGIADLVEKVKLQDQSVVGHELNPTLPDRGPVCLQVHLSPLKDNHEQTTGIAIVVDDLTERRRLEEQVRQVRGTFERYVVPRVVEQLLSDPNRLQLGGVRQDVTILFADIRGFTAFSEKLDPEILVKVLNRYLTLAADAVLAEEGTLDKFMGDAMMAMFNAPLDQPDHAMRAVRAALTMQRQIAALNAATDPSKRLTFGVGIATGPAVVGNIGSTVLQSYTAIGDSVNLASRLQNHAWPGQILLNPESFELVREQVVARELGYVQVKGHSGSDLVYEVLGLKE